MPPLAFTSLQHCGYVQQQRFLLCFFMHLGVLPLDQFSNKAYPLLHNTALRDNTFLSIFVPHPSPSSITPHPAIPSRIRLSLPSPHPAIPSRIRLSLPSCLYLSSYASTRSATSLTPQPPSYTHPHPGPLFLSNVSSSTVDDCSFILFCTIVMNPP